jgi:hypothetical protein
MERQAMPFVMASPANSADHGDSPVVGASQDVIMILFLNEKVTSPDGDRCFANVLPGLGSKHVSCRKQKAAQQARKEWSIS